MDRVKLVEKHACRLQDLIDELKRRPEAFECGALACFVGIVRGLAKDGSKVKKLIYEAWREKALETLQKIRDEILRENQNVKDLLLYHVVDELEPGEETLFIVALGKHRQDALNAVHKALERIKVEPPIWKKEVTERGAYWIHGN